MIAKTADTINTNADNNGERIATAISTPVSDLLENIFNKFAVSVFISPRQDSNPRSADLESAVLDRSTTGRNKK